MGIKETRIKDLKAQINKMPEGPAKKTAQSRLKTLQELLAAGDVARLAGLYKVTLKGVESEV